MYRLWYSTESVADYIIDHTLLVEHQENGNVEKCKLFESDASRPRDFHKVPDHIKKILYLDAPDLIVELNTEPIFSLEISTEAGTGHNVFQRFARIAASVENNVPAFYIYPEAAIIHRNNNQTGWDRLNPLIFKALIEMMDIYRIPALYYYFPSDFRTFFQNPTNSPNLLDKGLNMDENVEYAGCPDGQNEEMGLMFQSMNEIISTIEQDGIINGRSRLIRRPIIRERRQFMESEFVRLNGNLNSSPLSSTIIIDTRILLNYLTRYENDTYQIGELLRNREKTVLYKVNAKFRGDPYPGALAAIDYLLCREGRTFEERQYNLVMVWGELKINDDESTLEISGINKTINDFVRDVKRSERKNLLGKDYEQLNYGEIPRYYMQVRYGSMYSKVKHIRVYSYFSDAILFPDGALWRDA